MTQAEILKTIKELAWINNLLSKVEVQEIKADTPTINYWDSLDLTEICAHLEKEYDIHISQRQIETVHTFGDLAELVQNMCPKQ